MQFSHGYIKGKPYGDCRKGGYVDGKYEAGKDRPGGKWGLGVPRPPIIDAGIICEEVLAYGWYRVDAAAWADAEACAACTAEAIAIADAIVDVVVVGWDKVVLLDDAARAACICSAANALVDAEPVDGDKVG